MNNIFWNHKLFLIYFRFYFFNWNILSSKFQQIGRQSSWSPIILRRVLLSFVGSRRLDDDLFPSPVNSRSKSIVSALISHLLLKLLDFPLFNQASGGLNPQDDISNFRNGEILHINIASFREITQNQISHLNFSLGPLLIVQIRPNKFLFLFWSRSVFQNHLGFIRINMQASNYKHKSREASEAHIALPPIVVHVVQQHLGLLSLLDCISKNCQFSQWLKG